MGRPGLVGTMARTAVVAGTASAVVGHSQNKAAAAQAQQAQLDQANAVAQQAAIDQAVEAKLAQAAPPAAPGGGDVMAQLQQLADMKAQGLLSDEEFAAMKAKLISA